MMRDRRSSEGRSSLRGARCALMPLEHAPCLRRRKESFPKHFVPDLLIRAFHDVMQARGPRWLKAGASSGVVRRLRSGSVL